MTRAFVVMFVLLAALCAGCKKKSACEKQCERYAKCDEATPSCSVLCKQISPEVQATMKQCDETAKGDCEAFLACTGAAKKPLDAAEPAPEQGMDAADAGAAD